MLHPDLQKLLDFALQDGELSEKESEILHKKAVELGEDVDVLEMVIEGELQKISKSNKDEKQKKIDCPNCGSSIPSSSIKCGFCGFEISKTAITGHDSIKILSDKLTQIDISETEIEKKSNALIRPYSPSNGAQRKASVISTFSMPNDKEHLVEFFLFCDNNADAYSNTSVFMNASGLVNKIYYPAWAGKARLGYNKLKRFENEDDEIRQIIETYKNKYHVDAKDMKQSTINYDRGSGNGKAVLLGLNQTGVIIFFVLLLFCFPLCWLPFILPACKA